jgi:hypothetical protein
MSMASMTSITARRRLGRKAAHRATALRAAAGAALLLGLAGCDQVFSSANDPLVREGLFQPGHSNHQNLVLQVANPADLVRGSGTTGADGQLAAAAVDRLRNEKVKKLPASDIAQVSTSNTGDNNGQGGGGQ